MAAVEGTLHHDVLVPVLGTIDGPTSAYALTPDVDPSQCRLLGPFALVIQAVMGALVIGSLILKRHRETPKRPWKVWLGDVSKQVLGQLTVHALNVLISDRIAAHHLQSACTLYFLNVLIDTTVGVALLYFFLTRLTTLLIDRFDFTGLTSGHYGSPPALTPWSKQLVVYIVALAAMKLVVVLLFWLFPSLFDVGDWLLDWLGDNPDVQVFFVMMIFPLVMNVVQFILIDSIIKSKTTFYSTHADDPSRPRPSSLDDSSRRFLDDSSDDDDDDDAISDSGAYPRHSHPDRDLERGPSPRPPSYKSQKSAAGSQPLGRQKTPTVLVTSPSDHSYPPIEGRGGLAAVAAGRSNASTSSLSKGHTASSRADPWDLDDDEEDADEAERDGQDEAPRTDRKTGQQQRQQQQQQQQQQQGQDGEADGEGWDAWDESFDDDPLSASASVSASAMNEKVAPAAGGTEGRITLGTEDDDDVPSAVREKRAGAGSRATSPGIRV